MLPLLKEDVSKESQTVLRGMLSSVPLIYGPGIYPNKSEQPQFFGSTLIVELMGLARADAISCTQQLSDQFLLHAGVVPTTDGIYTFYSAVDPICSQLTSLEVVEDNTAGKANEANLRHVQTLLWAWEQITGQKPKFNEPMLPKFRGLPVTLQPNLIVDDQATVNPK